MKLKTEVVIDAGRAIVWRLFDDEIADGRTCRCVYWNLRFTGAMKFTAFLFRRSMRKRVEADMRCFRAFVEAETREHRA